VSFVVVADVVVVAVDAENRYNKLTENAPQQQLIQWQQQQQQQ